MTRSQNQFHWLGKMVCNHNENILEMVQYVGGEH
jgi:hypothetical protein